MEGFLWLIQSPSGTGCRTEAVGFDMIWFSPFWFVEDVRGGMALGERSWEFWDAISDGPGARDIALVYSKLLRFSAFELMLSSSIGVLARGSRGRARLIVAGGSRSGFRLSIASFGWNAHCRSGEVHTTCACYSVDRRQLRKMRCPLIHPNVTGPMVPGRSLFVCLQRRRRSLYVQPNSHAAAVHRCS